MLYVSTRGGMPPQPFSEILLAGLAPDGGLTVPATHPRVSDLEAWRGLTYPELATEVVALFATDIAYEDLSALCAAAYANFGSEVVPLRPLTGGITLVGLSEGPTLAFKDMAMQLLGELLEHVLEQKDQTLTILGATSGDTGSAAEHALRGKERVSVVMLSPQGRMSPFQRAQMYSLTDDNIHNVAVEGVFDDCQHLVKELSGDLAFKQQHRLGAVNSINLARIVAQTVYYVWAWLRATDDSGPREIDVAVPTGNFGNLLSGRFAQSLGVPIRRLVLATNENKVLDEFFRTGIYRPRSSAETEATSSPSMDISKASNLERFLFELVDRDPERMTALWAELDETGAIDLSAEQPRFATEFAIVSGTSTHADRLATIARVHDTSGVVIDPHTADGVKVAFEYLDPEVPMLVLETAKPEKFADTIREALGTEITYSAELQEMLAAPQHVTNIANDPDALRAFVAAHTR